MVDSVDVSARRRAFPQPLTLGPSNIRSLTHVTTLTASDGPAKDQQHRVARADQTTTSEPADDFDPAIFARFVVQHDSDGIFLSDIQWRRGALPLRPDPSHSQRCLVSQRKGG
jgi:hypothetical protein